MNREQLSKIRKEDKENARILSGMVNNFSFSPEKVAWALTLEHRTLQQTITRFAVAWLKVCASEDYMYDGRNEDSHIVAKKLMAGHEDDIYLPFI